MTSSTCCLSSARLALSRFLYLIFISLLCPFSLLLSFRPSHFRTRPHCDLFRMIKFLVITWLKSTVVKPHCISYRVFQVCQSLYPIRAFTSSLPHTPHITHRPSHVNGPRVTLSTTNDNRTSFHNVQHEHHTELQSSHTPHITAAAHPANGFI